MSFARNSAVFHPAIIEILNKFPIEVVDIGASGHLVDPWATCDEKAGSAFQFIGFEPDETECNRLVAEAAQSHHNNKTYFPLALWKSDNAEVALHLAKDLSTSSVHPPNDALLSEYATRHAAPRETQSVISLHARTLDHVLSDTSYKPDFLKIDTQGSELEILMGAETILSESCFGCTVETWTSEVHRGQGLTFTVMQFMNDAGFRAFDLERSAVWQRQSGTKYRKNRGELIGVDILYLKPLREIKLLPPKKQLKAAILADLWGYRSFAAEILNNLANEHVEMSSAADHVLSVIKQLDRRIVLKSHSKFRRLLDLVLPRIFGVRPMHPEIH